MDIGISLGLLVVGFVLFAIVFSVIVGYLRDS